MSVILLERGMQPEPWYSASVLDITEKEEGELESMLAWYKKQAGEDFGDTLPAMELVGTAATGGDKVGMPAVTKFLAQEMQYEVEGQYDSDCPFMMKYGIARG